MKKIIIGFILIGLTNLVQAQNDLAVVVNTPTANKTKTKVIKNAAYLRHTNRPQNPKRIGMLHKKVAEFNIKALALYTPEKPATYTVVFTEGSDTIKSTYNHNGDIVSCKESFKGINLPYAISAKVSKEYPGWKFNNTVCTIRYSDTENNQAKIVYKVVLKNGNQRKMIKINP
ncbi:hypothetical protein [Cellulophaga sp. Z1A5H]|uniref:hypothetical protein n=1 Tax=Cellulophaga sp. Z1A5H TaxID=2687291 RepID=UPI0013FD39AD|nr:hypothetical protein [Cellulophaga sp. Z1A5H]